MLCSLNLFICIEGLELLRLSQLVYPVTVLYVTSELCSAGNVAALYFLFSIFALKTCSAESIHEWSIGGCCCISEQHGVWEPDTNHVSKYLALGMGGSVWAFGKNTNSCLDFDSGLQPWAYTFGSVGSRLIFVLSFFISICQQLLLCWE